MHNGVRVGPPPDPAVRAAVRAELDLPEGEVVALVLGELEPRKDPLTAARAAIQARERGAPLTLLVAGSGPLANELAALAGDAVRPLGYRTDPQRLLAAADIFMLPSEREGLSFAVLEAMATGLALVVADGPGNPEAVGEAGLVLPAGDAEAFATTLAELAADPERRAQLGAAARARAAERFTLEAMCDGVRAAYEARAQPLSTQGAWPRRRRSARLSGSGVASESSGNASPVAPRSERRRRSARTRIATASAVCSRSWRARRSRCSSCELRARRAARRLVAVGDPQPQVVLGRQPVARVVAAGRQRDVAPEHRRGVGDRVEAHQRGRPRRRP